AEHNKPLIGIDHMEGHLYSSFVQNSQGNPKREFEFPYLVLLVSGGHTDLVLFKNHLQYEILGSKRDDAAGEALDKAGRLLGFGYPGAPTMERLSEQVENADKYKFPRPMIRSGDLDFSFAGLKTAFLYFVKKLPEEEKVENLNYLASSFQEAVFQTLVSKTKDAIIQTGVKSVLLGGGVSVNKRLRTLMKRMVKEQGGSVYFPSYKYLNFDNAAMIGVAASFRAERKLFVKDLSELDRKPRLSLKDSSVNPIV
ncbi:MAG: tRNA (adenosine(37)-N6)-threonylcarbamoyltransferase complex transferase subunit TsaD, partial [Weeksellaceae bacterium]